MANFPWLTDIHLNFVTAEGVEALLDRVGATDPAGVLLSGDIGESHDLLQYLARFEARLDCPIYFVLGNHDFYRSSIARVRSQVEAFCQDRPQLIYLSQRDSFPLTEHVGIIGHDGWADGRAGDYDNSDVLLNDYLLIKDFAPDAPLPPSARKMMLEILGDEAADHVRRVIEPALDQYTHVVLLTHVPPFREACWHQGRISDDNWAPHFTCLAVGRVVLEVMQNHPDRRLTILCGHTHGRGEYRPLENVAVLTGGAEYRHPAIEQVLQF